jgi:hypothetical protein
MADERDTEIEVDPEVLEDLDASDDADRVLGGKKKASCPCEGGELH